MGSKFTQNTYTRAMAQVLNAKDPVVAPGSVNTDLLQPTIEATPLLQSEEVYSNFNMNGVSAAGAAIVSNQVFCPEPDERLRVFQLDFTLIFDGAGATAFNGKQVALFTYLQAPVGDPAREHYIHVLRPWTVIRTGVLVYQWAMQGSAWLLDPSDVASAVCFTNAWDGYMLGKFLGNDQGGEDEGHLYLRFYSMDNTVFPANTTYSIQGICRRGVKFFPPPP